MPIICKRPVPVQLYCDLITNLVELVAEGGKDVLEIGGVHDVSLHHHTLDLLFNYNKGENYKLFNRLASLTQIFCN